MPLLPKPQEMTIRAQAFEDCLKSCIEIARECGANERTIARLREEYRRAITMRSKAEYVLRESLRG